MPGRPRAVGPERADRQRVALAGEEDRRDAAHEVRGVGRHGVAAAPVVVGSAGTGTAWRWASAASIAAKFARTTAAPRRPYDFSAALRIFSIASSRGSTPDSAKKHVCMTDEMRRPRPAASATDAPSIT